MPQFELESLNQRNLREAYVFLETVFTQEQHIPKELIPLPFQKQHWWCIRANNEIIGTVAAWKDGTEWHWGRLAVSASYRGHGLGKKIAVYSFTDLFEGKTNHIVIDARDITVQLLLSLGAKITGTTTEFYGIPITPMELHKSAFEQMLKKMS